MNEKNKFPGFDEKKCRKIIGREIALVFDRIKSERKISFRAIADVCGITPPTISNIRNGKHSPSVQKLLNIFYATGCTDMLIPFVQKIKFELEKGGSVSDVSEEEKIG